MLENSKIPTPHSHSSFVEIRRKKCRLFQPIMKCTRWPGSGRTEIQLGSLAPVLLADGADAGASQSFVAAKVLFVLPGVVVVATQVRRVVGTDCYKVLQVNSGGVTAIDNLFSEGGFYYSDQTDLSARYGKKDSRPDFVFNWSTFQAHPELSRPLIWGYVGAQDGVTLIARRLVQEAGTRFRKRGANEEGRASNYVELEQIVEGGSYVQVRGSIPIVWSQDHSGRSFNPRIDVHPNRALSQNALQKHFAWLRQEYGMPIETVSLLKHNDHEENDLRVAFVEHLSQTDSVLHEFDLHKKCKTSFVPLVEFVNSLSIEMPQKKILRVNCKDSIDRTGLVQAEIFRVALTKMREGRVGENVMQLYVDASNAISISYCGTVALREEVIWNGRKTMLGLMKDGIIKVCRYYSNAYLDGPKQDTIDSLQGKFPLSQIVSRHVWYPKLKDGFVSGPIHFFVIFLLVIYHFIIRKIQSKINHHII